MMTGRIPDGKIFCGRRCLGYIPLLCFLRFGSCGMRYQLIHALFSFQWL